MYKYSIYSKDSEGNIYLDEIVSSFDIRDRLKMGDILPKGLLPKRKIYIIEEEKSKY